MLETMPSPKLSPLGFQAASKVSELNQNQPANERNPTGMITPQTVIDPILPVTLGPPKFATVVSQSKAITPMQVMIGVDDSKGRNADRYPSAEMAIATLPIARDRK